jgi:putative PIN family toxin of toxin-antitoxin system
MRAVVDTNVLVSGILSATGPPARIVEAIFAGAIEPVYDPQILAEYEDVLTRVELGLPTAPVGQLLTAFEAFGMEVVAPPWPLDLPDPDDAPFLAVAAAADCPLVTGILRHFPARARRGVSVWTPRELVERLRRLPSP